MGGFVTISLKFSLCPICLLMQLSVQKRGFLAVELNPNHNSCGNERWSFLLGFSSKSVSDIYIYFFFLFFFSRYPVWFSYVSLYVFFSCVRPAVSRGSKAPPKVRQLDRQRDSGKKRRTQPIQVMAYVTVHKVANSFLLLYLHFMFSHLHSCLTLFWFHLHKPTRSIATPPGWDHCTFKVKTTPLPLFRENLPPWV